MTGLRAGGTYADDRRRRAKAARTGLYALLTFLMTLLQLGVLPYWKVGGVHPLWLPVLAVMIAVREGGDYGLGIGAVCGLLCDVLMPRGGVFFTLTLMLGCYLAGLMVEQYFRRTAATTFLWCLGIFAVMELLYFLFLYLLPGRAGFSALWRVALPELTFSVLSGMLLYWPVKWVAKLQTV